MDDITIHPKGSSIKIDGDLGVNIQKHVENP
jgi:hypothetical protein